MKKDKQQFRTAVDLLREANLDPDQTEALAVVERYPGELRRQIAALSLDLDYFKRLHAADENNLVELQKAEQTRLHLEEKIRVLESRINILQHRVGTLEEGVPQPLAPSLEPHEAVRPIAKYCNPVFSEALLQWPKDKGAAAMFFFAIALIRRACPVMAGQVRMDNQLEEELIGVCSRHLERLAPGKFTWMRKSRPTSPAGESDQPDDPSAI